MNEWVRKSIEFANGKGYLDNLHKIYPVSSELWREIPIEVKKDLEKAYKSGNNLSLVKNLLRLPKFPIDDPYVAFLRKNEIFLKYNPKTVNRIARRVRSLGFKTLIEAAEQPKSSSRRIGTLFRTWLSNLGYPMLSEDEFKKTNGISFYKGSDIQLKNFANRELGCGLDKNPDFLAKAGNNYIVGETKFLTDFGGAQNANFEDALKLLKGKNGNALRIAVLDGVVWIKDSTKMYKTVCNLEETALTALLLKEFLESKKGL